MPRLTLDLDEASAHQLFKALHAAKFGVQQHPDICLHEELNNLIRDLLTLATEHEWELITRYQVPLGSMHLECLVNGLTSYFRDVGGASDENFIRENLTSWALPYTITPDQTECTIEHLVEQTDQQIAARKIQIE